MFTQYTEFTTYDEYGVANTMYYELGTDESRLYIDQAAPINAKHNIPADISVLKMLVKIGNEPELICLVKRHSFVKRESASHKEEFFVWQIYDSEFTYPKRSVNEVDDVKPIYVLFVLGQYKDKEDAQLNFKESAELYFRGRVGVNPRFLAQLSSDDSKKTGLSFINDRLLAFLDFMSLMRLRLTCKVPFPKTADYYGRRSIPKIEDRSQYELATKYYKAGEYSRALELFQGMLRVRRRMMAGFLGTEETATLAYNIGSALMAMDRAPEALTYLRDSYNTRTYVLEDGHDKTIKAKEKVEACSAKLSAG